MAIDEADQSDAGQFSDGDASDAGSRDHGSSGSGSGVRVGAYTWAEFMSEHGHGDEVDELYPDDRSSETDGQLGLDTDQAVGPTVPREDDWDRVEFDPEAYLGFHPDRLESVIGGRAKPGAKSLQKTFLDYVDPETTPVTKDVYTWEHYKWEYYYEDDGSRPRDGSGEIVRHDEEAALGFDPETIEEQLSIGDDIAMELDDIVEERTVNVQEEFDEDEFFSTADGTTTVANRYDLEKAVPLDKKTHFREIERYWVNKPYACVVIFHSEKENEKKYYMIEPYLNEIEMELQEFLSGKLRTAIKYSDEGIKEKASEDGRRTVIENETRRLLKRYDLFEKTSSSTKAGLLETLQNLLDEDDEEESTEDEAPSRLEGIEVRPEPAILADDPDTLSEYQVEKILYLLKRNFIGYERIDGIKHDINVEDISVDGYNSPVFVYHSEYEQIISNIYHGKEELDDFVVKLAQRSGKGISKRLPQVDATLPDGSRAQLTLGKEVSDHGTNYTIRQFKDVPFTPIDLINWNTFSLDEMAFLWLCIENHKSLIFAGGTASGKTTSLNAVSLFIPSSAKIVSIEDTREVELPQRNWIASVTRPSFSDDEQGDVDEFDLLEAALRQRPDYIVMGEIRGEEGRTLFQVMSTGHTTYTTFHADSVDEVLKRFTTDPINVSKTMFSALDLVSIQTQTRVQGSKVRRNKSLTEINHYEAENDEINVQDVYQWQAETDEFLKMGDSNTLDEIKFDRGWSTEKLQDELFKREVILAYLIKNGLNTYAEVAATVQAFVNDPDTILTLIANGQLEDSLDDLREMESVLIDVDPEKEELVPRPDATSETYNTSMDLLERAEESLFEEYRGEVPSGLASALGATEQEEPIEVDSADTDAFDFAGAVDQAAGENDWDFGGESESFASGADAGAGDEPAWLNDDTGFDIGGSADADSTATADSTAPVPAETAPSSDAATERTGVAEADDDAGQPGGVTADEPPSLSSSPDQDGPEILPSDDPEDGDFGGLFSDMGETLDRMEETPAREPEEPRAETDTSGFDSMFPDDSLGSIFDPDADNSPATMNLDEETEAETETVAQMDATSPRENRHEAAGSEPATADDASTPEEGSAPQPERDDTDSDTPEPPTIDLGGADTDDDESATERDDTDPDTPEPPTIDLGGGGEDDGGRTKSDEDDSGAEITEADDTEMAIDDSSDDPTGDGEQPTATDEPASDQRTPEPPTIDLGTDPAADDDGDGPPADDSSDGQPSTDDPIESAEPPSDDGEQPESESAVSIDDGEQAHETDAASEPTIDGDGQPDEVDIDDGSMFDAGAESGADEDGSAFEEPPAEESVGTDDETGIFGDSDGTDDDETGIFGDSDETDDDETGIFGDSDETDDDETGIFGDSDGETDK